MAEEDFKEKIYKFLADNDTGATASDIAKSINSNRMTVTKYLDIMKSQDLVMYKGIGMAKLWRINLSPLLESFDNGENMMLRKAMELLGEGVVVVDKETRLIWYNSIMEDYLGKLEKNKGKRCCELAKLEPMKNKEHCITKTLNTGKVCKSVQKLITENGKIYYFEVVSTPIHNKKEIIIGAILLVIDLNDYERKMKELRTLLGK